MANTLITLPTEILHHILKYLDPRDLGRVFLACKDLSKFLYDTVLYKEVYCQILDAPKKGFKPADFDYKQELLRFFQVRNVLTSEKPVEEKLIKLRLVSDFLARLCFTSYPIDSNNLKYMKEWFYDSKYQRKERDNIEAFLCQSTTFFRARHQDNSLPSVPFEDRQASAKLHVLYGAPIFLPRTRRWQGSYPYAVSMVYDLRNYTEETKWGPYLPDGKATVDWEKMEAVMIVLGHNLHAFSRQTHGIFPKLWTESFEGIAPDSYIDDGRGKKDRDDKNGKRTDSSAFIPRSLRSGLDDPYNITGTWTRVVCFLDFHDLFAYNFTTGQPPSDQPRPALNTTEAIRLITMEIRATRTEAPGPEDGQELPVVYFEGNSRSSLNTSWDPNANSNIRGTVRLTKEGEVRWKTISVYSGEERWASEGIQVGGVRSARGVLGHWFDKDHDIHGPAGPTAFWKQSDGFEDPPKDDEEHHHLTYHETHAYDDDEEEEEEEEEEDGEGIGGMTEAELELPLDEETADAVHNILSLIAMGHLPQH